MSAEQILKIQIHGGAKQMLILVSQIKNSNSKREKAIFCWEEITVYSAPP
jgi:hypothetical protein